MSIRPLVLAYENGSSIPVAKMQDNLTVKTQMNARTDLSYEIKFPDDLITHPKIIDFLICIATVYFAWQ
jgi:hypothetical protein